MRENCSKVGFYSKVDALIQATFDEWLYEDKRKVYWCFTSCNAWHTSREKVHGDQPLLER